MRSTPWGEMWVNDAHLHFFSETFYAELARAKGLPKAVDLAPLLGWEIPQSDEGLATRWISQMDSEGIQKACLIASLHGEEQSVGAAVAAYPNRFWGASMLDPTQPDARERLLSAVKSLSLRCVCFFPAMHTFSIADGRLLPLLEIASDHHLIVFVHCGALSVGVRRKLELPSQFDLRYSNPIDLHPVALHFPQIRFVVPHFGAGMFREILMLADLCPNVYLDTSSTNRWMAYEELDLRTVLRRALAVAGVDRLVFGSDSSFFPRGWHAAIFEAQARALYELGLGREDAEKIFRTNAEKLYESAGASVASGRVA